MPDWTEEAVIVESVDPAQGGGHFDCRRVWPRSLPPDDLGFVEAVDGLDRGVKAPIFAKRRAMQFQVDKAC